MGGSQGDDATLGATSTGPPRPGSSFAGRYRIERTLGRGGMGIVFAAHDEVLGERVALKLLTVGTASPEVLERFRREVRLARKVTHRNVARTYDIGEHEGLHYLTMELIDGRSLAAMTEHGRLEPARVVDLAAQILDGLAVAHAAGIVHRDLKPANVLVETGGRVVVTDFGIARTGSDAQLTGDGGVVGTLAYMAPEQIAGRPADARADVYAFGLMLYEMLTGTAPFPADTPLASAVARIDAPPPDPRSITAISDALAQLVVSCLQPDPDRRPADAGAVARALADLSRSAPASTATQSSGSGATPTSGTSSSFVSAVRPEQGLAVLPLQYRGPAEDAYLADALTDELIDVLSMTKGLRVPARGATARFTDDRDPERIGRELGVRTYLDGTVQRAGSQIRIAVRLVDTHSQVQTWSERYTGELGDVFEFQERMSRRIAETLRVELDAMGYHGTAPAEAVELYFRARRLGEYRRFDADDDTVVMFERCLALAPDFGPALAGYAQACVMAWFLPALKGRRDWAALCRDAVDQALQRAPELPESHYAAARYAAQLGDYAEAARRLSTALQLAPTYANAHEYLGTLQMESGRMREGRAHVELALELDPTLWSGRIVLARHLALRSDLEGFDREIARLHAEAPASAVPATILEMRVAMWTGDLERANRAVASLQRFSGPTMVELQAFAQVYLGRASIDALETRSVTAQQDNPRFLALLYQMVTEALCMHQQAERAAEFLHRANAANLVDLDWLDHCVAIAPLRPTAAMDAVRGDVARRAQAIWTR